MLSEEKQKELQTKLLKAIGHEGKLPDWCNAAFVSSSGLEVWVDPGAEAPPIPSEIDGVSVVVKVKGPGHAC